MSTLTTPTLPQTTEAFDLSAFTSLPTVVIDSIWNTMEPEEGGAYTAHLLTATDSDSDGLKFAVVSIIGDIEFTGWEIFDAVFYDSVLTAAEDYTNLSGGR